MLEPLWKASLCEGASVWNLASPSSQSGVSESVGTLHSLFRAGRRRGHGFGEGFSFLAQQAIQLPPSLRHARMSNAFESRETKFKKIARPWVVRTDCPQHLQAPVRRKTRRKAVPHDRRGAAEQSHG